MNDQPEICILYGGVGNERAVSLQSGQAVVEALKDNCAIIPHELNSESVPEFIDPERMIVIPVLHGSFGENGELQKELEQRGIEYCGCDSRASAVCIDKSAAKSVANEVGALIAPHILFSAGSIPTFEQCASQLGEPFVIKPVNEGSSVGLYIIDNPRDFSSAVQQIHGGPWMAESRIEGLETSIGVISGKAQGIVAIRPEGGVYDYKRKYVAGSSTYEFPANLSDSLTLQIQRTAESIFRACGCRDYARIDFIVNLQEKPMFLEINSLPGLTPTSLLPRVHRVMGLTSKLFYNLCSFPP